MCIDNCGLRMMCYLRSCISTQLLENGGFLYLFLTYWSYISSICCFFLNELILAFFCWTVMIVSCDTGADYDVTFEEHAIHGWCEFGGGLRGEIRPFVIYLCFVLVGTNLGFIYLHGSMLYLFPELDPWVLFGDLFMRFDDVMHWSIHTFIFYDLRIFYKWSLYDMHVFMEKNYAHFH